MASANISSAYQFYITWWVNSQNIAANTSNVTVQWHVRKIGYDSASYNSNARMNADIDGEHLVTTSQYLTNWNGNRGWDMRTKAVGFDYCYYSITRDYAHNTDGTRQLYIYGYFEPNTGLSTSHWANVQVREYATLPTIPRTSSVSASAADIGGVSTVTINRASSAFTHTLRYTFGGLSGTIAVNTAAVSVGWTVPDSFYTQIPNARAGTAAITCETYSGGVHIGTSACSMTVTTPGSSGPAVSGTVVDSNAVTKALTGDQNKLVRYFSTAACTIAATAKCSASIVSRSIAGAAVSGTTRSIGSVETGSFLFGTTDSRGYSASATVNKTLVNYVRLTCNAAATRVKPTGSDATLSLSGNYFNASFGAVSNTLTVIYRLGGGEAVTVTPKMSGNTWSATVALSDMSYTSAYTITVTVADKLMNVTKTVTLSRGIPVFDWGANSFRVNAPLGVTGGFEHGGSQMGRPNLLTNWYFVDPINQRGRMTYSGAGYTIDRLYAQSGTMSIGVGGITFSGGVFIQRVETGPAEAMRDRIATISVLTRDRAFYAGSGLMGGVNSPILSMPNGVTVSACYLSGETQFIRIVVPTGVSVTLMAVKLEMGVGSTLARKENGVWVLNDPPPDRAAELAKCQRYYMHVDLNHFAGTCGWNQAHAFIPCRMRIAPVVNAVRKGTVFYGGSYLILEGTGPRLTADLLRDGLGVNINITNITMSYIGAGVWCEMDITLDAEL